MKNKSVMEYNYFSDQGTSDNIPFVPAVVPSTPTHSGLHRQSACCTPQADLAMSNNLESPAAIVDMDTGRIQRIPKSSLVNCVRSLNTSDNKTPNNCLSKKSALGDLTMSSGNTRNVQNSSHNGVPKQVLQQNSENVHVNAVTGYHSYTPKTLSSPAKSDKRNAKENLCKENSPSPSTHSKELKSRLFPDVPEVHLSPRRQLNACFSRAFLKEHSPKTTPTRHSRTPKKTNPSKNLCISLNKLTKPSDNPSCENISVPSRNVTPSHDHDSGTSDRLVGSTFDLNSLHSSSNHPKSTDSSSKLPSFASLVYRDEQNISKPSVFQPQFLNSVRPSCHNDGGNFLRLPLKLNTSNGQTDPCNLGDIPASVTSQHVSNNPDANVNTKEEMEKKNELDSSCSSFDDDSLTIDTSPETADVKKSTTDNEEVDVVSIPEEIKPEFDSTNVHMKHETSQSTKPTEESETKKEVRQNENEQKPKIWNPLNHVFDPSKNIRPRPVVQPVYSPITQTASTTFTVFQHAVTPSTCPPPMALGTYHHVSQNLEKTRSQEQMFYIHVSPKLSEQLHHPISRISSPSPVFGQPVTSPMGSVSPMLPSPLLMRTYTPPATLIAGSMDGFSGRVNPAEIWQQKMKAAHYQPMSPAIKRPATPLVGVQKRFKSESDAVPNPTSLSSTGRSFIDPIKTKAKMDSTDRSPVIYEDKVSPVFTLRPLPLGQSLPDRPRVPPRLPALSLSESLHEDSCSSQDENSPNLDVSEAPFLNMLKVT